MVDPATSIIETILLLTPTRLASIGFLIWFKFRFLLLKHLLKFKICTSRFRFIAIVLNIGKVSVRIVVRWFNLPEAVLVFYSNNLDYRPKFKSSLNSSNLLGKSKP